MTETEKNDKPALEKMLENTGTLETPAVFANRFQVSVMPAGLVRITYAEGLGKDAPLHVRGAVISYVGDVEQLIQVLQRSVVALRAAMAARAAEAAKPKTANENPAEENS